MQYTYTSLFFRSIIVIGDRCWLPEILPSISHKFCLAEYLLGASIRWTFQNSYKDLGGFVKLRLPRGKSSEFFVGKGVACDPTYLLVACDPTYLVG